MTTTHWGEILLENLQLATQRKLQNARRGPFVILLGQRDGRALIDALSARAAPGIDLEIVPKPQPVPEPPRPDYFPDLVTLLIVLYMGAEIWVYVS